MSKISLNSITVKHEIEGDPFLYVGSIIDSKSGYLTPKLIKSTQQLESIYGDFTYSQMFKDLISRDIPVCLLPVITKESPYNKCSLRLTNNSELPYTHPKRSKVYESLDLNLIDIDEVVSGEYMYGLVLDFTDVTFDELSKLGSSGNYSSSYFVIDLGTFYDKDQDETKQLLRLVATNEYVELTTSSYSDNFKFLNPDITRFSQYSPIQSITEEDSIKATLKNICNVFNQSNGVDTSELFKVRCYTIEDLLIEYVKKFFSYNKVPIKDHLGEYVDLDEWKSNFIDFLYSEDFYITPNKNIVNWFKPLLDQITPTSSINLESLILDIQVKGLFYPQLIFKSQNPIRNLNLTNIKGLKMNSSFSLTQDQLCSHCENDKVIEFYSKVTGPVGSNINISVSKIPFHDTLYELNINNGLIFESFEVYLYADDTDELTDESMHISQVGDHSELVDVICYNYWFDGKLIDDRYYNIYDPLKPYDINNRRSTDELTLPVGEFTLNRFSDDPWDDDDLKTSFEVFKLSDFYPDLFLGMDTRLISDKLSYFNGLLDLVDINSEVIDPDDTISSQALINLYGDDLKLKLRPRKVKEYNTYPANNNRLLYFYGEVEINGIKYPGYYPYIFNLLYQDYLKFPGETLIYDPLSIKVGNYVYTKINDLKYNVLPHKIESINNTSGLLRVKLIVNNEVEYGIIKDESLFIMDSESDQSLDGKLPLTIVNTIDYLVNNKVNFLMYDNIDYFYEYIFEQLNQSSVMMVRYISSKYSRELLKSRHSLTGLHKNDVIRLLNQLNTNCLSQLKLIQSSTFNYEVNNDKVQVTFELSIPKLVNKVYKLNFTLNV